jgi:hypothetical protein
MDGARDFMTFRWLDDAALRAVWDAAVAIGLSSNSLRAVLPNEFAAMMPAGNNAGEQMLRDLNYMNTIEALNDGTVPLRRWLEAAYLMSRLHPKAAAFRGALAHLERRDGGDPSRPHEPGGAATPKPIWNVATAASLWQHPDANPLVNVMKNYQDPKELRDVAIQAGFEVALVDFGQSLDRAARELVERSFGSRKLRSVIEYMRSDPRIKRWHPELQAIMDRGGGR